MFHPPLVDETNKAFNIQPTELGFERGIFHEDVVGTNNTKPNDLMYWTQLISLNDLKPSVEVLASTTIKQTNKPPTPTPIILSMRFGLGGIIYTTTDEFWRWRSGRGEKVYEQFWVQLIRSTQTNKHSYTNKSIQIETNGSQYHPGTRLCSQSLSPTPPCFQRSTNNRSSDSPPNKSRNNPSPVNKINHPKHIHRHLDPQNIRQPQHKN